MSIRKWTAVALASLMLCGTLVGCGGRKTPDASSSEPIPTSDNMTSGDTSESTPTTDESSDTSTSNNGSSSTKDPGTKNPGNSNNATTKPATTTKTPTKDVTTPVTNLKWDFMKGKGGAESETINYRKRIVNAKDTLKITGTTYYFSANGNDQNDGKSPQTALKTPTRISRLPLRAGDGVLFERGSVFRLDEGISLQSGVSYGAYGSGNKPEFWFSIKNYGGSNLWTKTSTANVWQVTYNYPEAGILVINDGALVGNKVFSMTKMQKNGDFYSDGKGTLYFYSKSDPNKYADIEISSGGSFGGATQNVSNITVENLCIKYTSGHGFGFVGANNVTIRNCVLGWIGGAVHRPGTGDTTRLGNAIEFYNSSSNLTIENNWIYQVYDTGITFQGTRGPYKNISFKNNLIEYCTMAIEFWNDNKDDEISNVVIENNHMRFSNYGWGAMPDRGGRGAHIWGGWRVGKPYTNFHVVVRNNIFDCSYSNIISGAWEPVTSGVMEYKIEGNSYYQRNHIGADDLGYQMKYNVAFFFGVNAVQVDANNQAELEQAVKAVDPSAKTIKWLS